MHHITPTTSPTSQRVGTKKKAEVSLSRAKVNRTIAHSPPAHGDMTTTMTTTTRIFAAMSNRAVVPRPRVGSGAQGRSSHRVRQQTNISYPSSTTSNVEPHAAVPTATTTTTSRRAAVLGTGFLLGAMMTGGTSAAAAIAPDSSAAAGVAPLEGDCADCVGVVNELLNSCPEETQAGPYPIH